MDSDKFIFMAFSVSNIRIFLSNVFVYISLFADEMDIFDLIVAEG